MAMTDNHQCASAGRKPPVFVTGIAGFIGFHTAYRLLRDEGVSVVGLDNFNSYYDPQLKRDRIEELNKLVATLAEKEEAPSSSSKKTIFCEVHNGDLTDLSLLEKLFAEHRFCRVIHLAAQAGVRYSITNPHAYVQSNLVGFVNILECCRHSKVDHLVYASSSSVYGGNDKTPYAESDGVDHPMSMYAATKKANEVLAHSYSHLYNLPCTGLRFFTVYGPWGRPDMAVWTFTERILGGQPIELFDHGKPRRDFTFVDDIVEGVLRVSHLPPIAVDRTKMLEESRKAAAVAAALDPSVSWAPFRIMNIGGSQPHTVLEFVSLLEAALGTQAEKKMVDAQPGDVDKTEADTTRLTKIIDFVPQVSLAEGLKKWAEWYRGYQQHRKAGEGSSAAAAAAVKKE